LNNGPDNPPLDSRLRGNDGDEVMAAVQTATLQVRVISLQRAFALTKKRLFQHQKDLLRRLRMR